MHPESDREQLKVLLDVVLELPPDERAAFVATACPAALRDRLTELLADYEAATSFFEPLYADHQGVPASTDPPGTDPLGLVGRQVQHFAIEAHLGGGGMGVVYRAHDTSLDRRVALKFLPAHLSLDEAAKRRFIHEAQVASALDHPNLCTIHAIGEHEGQLFIAMPYYTGETLKHKLRRGPLPVHEAVDYARQTAAGLEAAHATGIIHRDIKPANLMITKRGRVVILDFGIATMQGRDPVESGATMGTIAYMSPEQTAGSALDPRTDLWSLGVVLYESLAGTRPFDGAVTTTLLHAIRHEAPLPLKTYRPETPKALTQTVHRLLEKDPADRYTSAASFIHALPNDPADAPPHYFSRLGQAVGYLAVFALVVLGVWNLTGGSETAPPYGAGRDALGTSRLGSNRVELLGQDIVLSENTIAVFPFSFLGGDDVHNLSQVMMYQLSYGLDGAGPVTSVHPYTVRASLGNELPAILDPAYGQTLAASLRAGRFILGDVAQLGQQIRISATLYDASAQEEERAEVIAEGTYALPAAVDELVIQLIGDALDAQLGDLASAAYRTTTNRDAFKAYLHGEELMLKGVRMFDDGGPAEAYREAVKLDSTFVLAWTRLLPAGHRPNLQRPIETWDPEQQKAAAYVKRYRDRLSDRERRLADVLMDDSSNFYVQLNAFGQVAEDNPTFSWAWHLLATFQIGFGPYYGYPASDALPLLKYALKQDPNSPVLARRLMALAAKTRDFELLDSLVVHATPALEATNSYEDHLLLLAAGRGDQEAMDTLLAQAEDGQIRWYAFQIALTLEDIALAQEVDEMAAFPTDHEQTILHAGRTLYATAQGRLRRADSLRVADFDVQPRYLRNILALASPYYPAPADQLANMRTQIAQWDTTGNPLLMWGYPHPNSRDVANEAKGYYAETIAFLKGLISFRQGDAAALARDRAELLAIARRKGPEAAGNFAHCLERVLTAMVLWKAKEYNEANSVLDVSYTTYFPGHGRPGIFKRWWFRNLTGSVRVFVRAEMFYEEGRYAEALNWYRALNDMAGGVYPQEGLLFLGPSYLRRADIHERLGEPQKAVEMYRRLVTLWKDADPELQGYVTEAQAHIDRLSAES